MIQKNTMTLGLKPSLLDHTLIKTTFNPNIFDIKILIFSPTPLCFTILVNDDCLTDSVNRRLYMGCLAEVLASDFDVNFKFRKESQMYLIEFILTYSNYDLKALAEVLDINTLLLSQVISGADHLGEDAALRLIDWFFIFISG